MERERERMREITENKRDGKKMRVRSVSFALGLAVFGDCNGSFGAIVTSFPVVVLKALMLPDFFQA